MKKNKLKNLVHGITYFLAAVLICISVLLYMEQISRIAFHVITVVDIILFILLYFFGYKKIERSKITRGKFIVYSVCVALFFVTYCVLYAFDKVGGLFTLPFLVFFYYILLQTYKKDKIKSED